jgi:hypothetical protein
LPDATGSLADRVRELSNADRLSILLAIADTAPGLVATFISAIDQLDRPLPEPGGRPGGAW